MKRTQNEHAGCCQCQNLKWLDAEVHLLPPEWCGSDYCPPRSESVLNKVLYTHPDREEALGKATVEGLLEEMSRSGVDGALIMGLPWSDASMCRRNNEYIAEVSSRYGSTFAGLGVLPPPGDFCLVDEIRRIDEQLGLKGVKVIPSWQGYRLNDRVFDEALQELTERNMILMPHTDHAFVNPAEADTSYALYQIGSRYPELKVVCPHLGGLLCLYNLHPPVKPALANMLFVTTVPTTMDMVRFAVDTVGSNRIAFGTDFPFNPSHDQVSICKSLNSLGLDAESYELIAGRNLNEFLGFEFS